MRKTSKWYENALHWGKPTVFKGYRKSVAVLDDLMPLPVHRETLRALDAGEEIPLHAKPYFRLKASAIPLIPGYSVVSKVKEHFVRLTFVLCSDGSIGLELARFETPTCDRSTRIEMRVAEGGESWAKAVCDFSHADTDTKVSIDFVMGFNEPLIVSALHAAVREQPLATVTQCARHFHTESKQTVFLQYITVSDESQAMSNEQMLPWLPHPEPLSPALQPAPCYQTPLSPTLPPLWPTSTPSFHTPLSPTSTPTFFTPLSPTLPPSMDLPQSLLPPPSMVARGGMLTPVSPDIGALLATQRKLRLQVYNERRRAVYWKKVAETKRRRLSATTGTAIPVDWKVAASDTFLVSATALASLSRQRACPSCGERGAEVAMVRKGLNTTLRFVCDCGAKDELGLAGEGANAAYAACLPYTGINSYQLEDALTMLGVTQQPAYSNTARLLNSARSHIVDEAAASCRRAMQEVINFQKAAGLRTIPVTFDAGWTHRREANEASAELLALVDLPNRRNPVIARHVVFKHRVTKTGKVLRNGNHAGTSSTMEHACLKAIFDSIQEVLIAEGMTLEIVVDGDLSTNATLRGNPLVSSIAVDLAHRKKRIPKHFDGLKARHPAKEFATIVQSLFSSYAFGATEYGKTEEQLRTFLNSGVVAHLSGDHSWCWSEICVHVGGHEELQLEKPNLIGMTASARFFVTHEIRRALETPPHQRLVTALRTSPSESFHHEKNRRLPKHLDYWKSFEERIAFAILQHNEGAPAALQCARAAFKVLDELHTSPNVGKRFDARDKQRKRNAAAIENRNAQREARRKRVLLDHSSVDVLQPYGVPDARGNVHERPSASFWPHAADGAQMCTFCRAFPQAYVDGKCGLCHLEEGEEDQQLNDDL